MSAADHSSPQFRSIVAKITANIEIENILTKLGDKFENLIFIYL